MPLQVIKTIIVALYITFIYFSNDKLTWKYAIKHTCSLSFVDDIVLLSEPLSC